MTHISSTVLSQQMVAQLRNTNITVSAITTTTTTANAAATFE
jgi:post-segregation antitoxin (ccd killing protein)